MVTKKEIINRIEEKAKKLVGTKFKYNPLVGCRNYKAWDKNTLIEFEEKLLN